MGHIFLDVYRHFENYSTLGLTNFEVSLIIMSLFVVLALSFKNSLGSVMAEKRLP